MPYKKRKTKRRRRQPSLVKFTTDTTKLAVTGLMGASLISTTGAALKGIAKK